MKRRTSEDPERSSSASTLADKLEAFFSGILQRYPRLPLAVGIGLAALILAALLMAKYSGKTP
jgi:hypothetical protein